MKDVKITMISFLMIGLLVLSLAACDWDGKQVNTTKSTPQPGGLLAEERTATYGADQFFIQLTAIAVEQSRGASQQANGAGSIP
jgi:hypothetical protein